MLIASVLLGYLWVVCTARPLQSLIAYMLGDRSVKNEGKLYPNPFLHGNLAELIFLSLNYFTKFMFPIFYWDRKPKDNFSLRGWRGFILKNQEIISYFIMFFVNVVVFNSLPLLVSPHLSAACRSCLIIASNVLFVLIIFDIALVLTNFILKKFFPQYNENILVRMLFFILVANLLQRLVILWFQMAKGA